MKVYEALQSRLKNQHLAIEQIISGLSETDFLHQPAPGKWNINNHIAHLTRYQKVFMGRIEKIRKGNDPVFGRYIAEDDPELEWYLNKPKAILLEILIADRDLIYSIITGLSDDELDLAGTHPKFGRLTILQWTEFFLLHEAHHLFSIFQLAKYQP